MVKAPVVGYLERQIVSHQPKKSHALTVGIQARATNDTPSGSKNPPHLHFFKGGNKCGLGCDVEGDGPPAKD